MMKQFKFCAVALAALTMFSCSKESTPGTEDPTAGKTVQITIAKSDAGKSSRGIQEPSGSAYHTPINGDKIEIFCFASNADAAVLLNRQTVPLTTVEGSQTGIAKQISNSVNYIYVVANTTPTATVVGSTTLKQLKDQAVTIATGDLQDITKTPMTNATNDPQTIDKTTDAAMWKLSLAISPVMARFEVASVEATADIAAFDLVGIYMDGYYPSFTLGAKSAGALVPLTTDGTLVPTTGAGWYYDLCAGSEGDLEYTAGEGKTWGYMLAPAGGQMPRIILKLANIKVKGAAHGLNYITVKSFKTPEGAEITALDRNTVYKIAKIEFNDKDTTIDPNQGSVSVSVTVSVLPWNEVIVTPEL